MAISYLMSWSANWASGALGIGVGVRLGVGVEESAVDRGSGVDGHSSLMSAFKSRVALQVGGVDVRGTGAESIFF